MAAQHRLRARTTPDLREKLQQLEEDHGLTTADAERIAAHAGLRALGYDTPQEDTTPIDPAEQLLFYVKRVGAILGVAGLTTVGYGVFGAPLFRIWGFGLLLAGFILIATEAFLREYNAPDDTDAPDLTVEEVLRG